MAAGNIKVVVRVRPFNTRELDRKAKCVVQMKDSQTILIPPHDAEERMRGSKSGKGAASGADGQKVFAFDKSYWSFDRKDDHYAGQDSLFGDLGIPLLDNAFQGYNNCIFAYGQTGSGKSYSMMGYGEEAGVIPKICQDMFERITAIQADTNLTCTVEVSYLEIYNERVRDLLNPATKGNLKVREHPSTGPYVEDLAKLVVRSFKEIENLMDEGNKARTVAATNMNETSSRSHAVFTLTLTQKRHDVETSMDTEKVAKISLVDLAGSERATSTGATGARLKEGAEINRSLSTLGRVIAALADLSSGKKKIASLVPYRDSVLTWLLKDSLGGNSLTAMIAAISPADINFEETLSTLRYADSAKRIKNHAVVNEDPNARMIRELKEELAQLRLKLGSGGGGTAGGIAEEQYSADTPLDKQIVSITQADGSVKKVSKAEITEQLNQSEKLYKDLNQTWEEKLLKTEQIHKEREAALEELGISIEKGFIGLTTPKKMPHLVNLSDDPLLAECLIYNLKPGMTSVGNGEIAGVASEIRLNGTKILKEHCAFENTDGFVTLLPRDGAAVMVNGQRISKPSRLRSGNRIILGDFHIFRFNHPQEARAERAEQSLLRHSVATSQLGSPAPRPGHDRTLSKADSDVDTDPMASRAESPFPSTPGRDSDWSFARREAASAILGVDQKISHLTDDELDSLFDDVQRARAVRRGRPESRLFSLDEDEDSVNSYPIGEKYLSNGTFDNFSIETSITAPATPQIGATDSGLGDDDKIQSAPRELPPRPDEVRDANKRVSQDAEVSAQDIEELKVEKAKVEKALEDAQEHLQLQLAEQKAAFEAKLEEMLKSKRPKWRHKASHGLDKDDKQIASYVVERWRRLRAIHLVEVLLKHAALLKEAQVMSQAMDKLVSFQFTIVHPGQDLSSLYDRVMNGISGDDDEALETTRKPCIAVRVVDFQHHSVHLWSLEKLELRIQAMRQMYQYLDRPDYLQHFRVENPFIESCLPHYSLIGYVQIPLTAVFEARVQDYDVLVVSPYTQETVGYIQLSLEPSIAQAPASVVKFNVVMHEMTGFAEHEGTDVHAQLSIPGISEDGGATTTQMIRDFNEGPVRFESVHSLSLPLDSPYMAMLQITIFARATTLHLDKLLSWDDMSEPFTRTVGSESETKRARIAESAYCTPEHHDVFAKVQLLEMAESGDYYPVEVEQNSNLENGTYQLHQGLQRRIVVHLTHTSNESLGLEESCSMRIGSIRLHDPWGKVPSLSTSPAISLRLVSSPRVYCESGGMTQMSLIGQWDSSLHDTALLDRPTADRYSIQLTLCCDIPSKRATSVLTFSFDIALQVRPRSWLRPQSMFKQLWKTTRVVHSTVRIFEIVLKPQASKKAMDLWRVDSQHQPVHGEEILIRWSPRGVSLVMDYLSAQRRRQEASDVEATRVLLSRWPLSKSSRINGTADDETLDANAEYTIERIILLRRVLSLWQTPSPPLLPLSHFATRPLSPFLASSADDNESDVRLGMKKPRQLTPMIIPLPKNPTVLKSGFLLTPLLTPSSQFTPPMSSDPTSSPSPLYWIRRFAELRPPYLHLYAVPSSEEIGIVGLRGAAVDGEPEVGRLLLDHVDDVDGDIDGGWENGLGIRDQSSTEATDRKRHTLFAIYGEGGSWVFRARSEAAKREWVSAVDRCFAGTGEAV
ncbi:kinesin-like protein Klp8 [Agyrium rufum]|nr:kinesin-like protein Klp8 [Agyrium rufum]